DKESWDLSTKEKIDAAEMKKEERNVLFKAGIYLSLKAVSEGNVLFLRSGEDSNFKGLWF
ncbi:hypothetical protein Tco_0189127, partial [Tanacetum coccineum]